MQLQNWLIAGFGWVLAGSAFVTVIRALGIRYQVRPSLPIGPRLRGSRAPQRSVSQHVRFGATRSVRTRASKGVTRQPQTVSTDRPVWWQDVPRSGSAPVHTASAGD